MSTVTLAERKTVIVNLPRMLEEMVRQPFADDPGITFRHVNDWQCEMGFPGEDVGVLLMLEGQNVCSEQSVRFLLNQHPEAKAICVSRDGKHAKVMTLKLDIDEIEQLDTHRLTELIKRQGYKTHGCQQ